MFSSGQMISENVLIIRIGTEKRLSSSYKQYTVSSLIVHERYSKESFENDLALIKLKETLILSENFRSICFSQLGSLPQASRGIAVGYGSTDKQNEYSDILRQAEMPIVDQEECLDSDPSFFRSFLFPGNFCAGEIGQTKGVCSGDSGKYSFARGQKSFVLICGHLGGGFYVRVNNNWYLQGLTSNTKESKNALNPTCNHASYALFTNVTFYAGNPYYSNEKIPKFS